MGFLISNSSLIDAEGLNSQSVTLKEQALNSSKKHIKISFIEHIYCGSPDRT
jgi:hypothetical protein